MHYRLGLTGLLVFCVLSAGCASPNATSVEPTAIEGNTSNPNKVVGPAVEGNTVPTATSPNVAMVPSPRFLGRFDTADAAGPRMSWPGSAIMAGFTGTSLSVGLAEVTSWNWGAAQQLADNFIDVIIDNSAPKVIKLTHGVNEYVLATGLAAGNHTVRISKRTESDMGTVQFTGFKLDAGAS
ncbi:MAG: hypothetical protein EOO38_08880, partial [Cytophagaceae bacterium]